MAKRSPEQGSSGQESVFQKDTAQRLSVLEAEVTASSIDQNKKEHLVNAAQAIYKKLDDYNTVSNKKDFKNSIHLEIASLELEFNGAKNSKRKTEATKHLKVPETKGKKDREEEKVKLLADLEEARQYLVSQSTAGDNLLFKNFGKYKTIKDEIVALLGIKDKSDYEAKKLKIEEGIYALMEVKKGENSAEVEPKEEVVILENLQPEPEEEEEKPIHKTKKTQKRKTDTVDERGREQIVKRNEYAVKRWDILQEIIGKMLGENSISEETTEAIENNLKIALASDDSEEYENAMSKFERDFDLIIRTIPTKARLEYFSQLNGNTPSWENKAVKENVKAPDGEPAPVVEKEDWQEDRDQKLEYADKRWALLRSIAMEKMKKEDRAETKENEENIENALEKLEETDDWNEYREQLREFEHNFAKVFLNVPEEVRKEYNRKKASLGKAEAVSTASSDKDKKDVGVVADDKNPVLDKETPEYRQKRYQNMNDKFVLFKKIAEEILTDEQIDSTRSLVEEIEESLNLTYHARNPREHGREIDRAESAFAELLTKVPSEVVLEFESQRAGNVPSLKKEDKATVLAVPEKNEVKDKELVLLKAKKDFSLLREIINRTLSPLLQATVEPKAEEFEAVLLLAEKSQNQAEFEKNIQHFEELFEKLCENLRIHPKDITEAFLQGEVKVYEEKVKKNESEFDLILTILNEVDADLVKQLSKEIGNVKGKIKLAKKELSAYSISQLDSSIWHLVTVAGNKSGKDIPGIFNERKRLDSGTASSDDPSVARVDMKVSDIEAAAAELENNPSPEQQMLLQMYGRDFGILEKMIESGGNQEIIDAFKWRMGVIRANIDKAKKEMSQHNKLDETVLYNMQALVEDLQKHYPKLHAEFMQKISPQVPAAPVPEKKGFFARAKETVGALFTKETGKKVVRGAYETVARVSGLKIASDFVYGLWTGKGDLSKGKGDLAEYVRGKRESKAAHISISAAYENLVSAVERSQENQALVENDQIEKRMAYLQSSVEAANISPEAKKQILQRLELIYRKHRDSTDKAKTARTEEVKTLLDSYIRAKVEGLQIAKDALNFALTATGFMFIRGAMYLSVSVAERLQKGRKEYAKENSGMVGVKSELAFVAKDAIVNTAIETARVLAGQGAKKGATKLQRAADVIKLTSRLLTAFGIAGAAFSETDTTAQTMDKFLSSVKENGVVDTVSDNFVQGITHVAANIERGAHAAVNPIDTVEQVFDRVTGHESIAPEITPPSPVAELPKEEVVAPVNTASVETVPEAQVPEAVSFSVQDFAAEHKLSEESLAPLQKLVEQYPSLKEESLVRILDASKVGDGVKFHHADVVRGDVDTLIEAEGERRSVIFEELVKAKDYEAAAKYLESQDFSSRHESYLSDYVGKGTHEDYVKFAKLYDEKPDKKMVYSLFRAMQGKGNTDLANAGFFRAATEDRTGRTVSLQGGELQYFGLDEKGEPILSGQGRVVVKETVMVKITTSPTVIENVSANDGMSVDDKLWANANVINEIQGEGPYEGSSKNAPAAELSEKDRAVLAEVEADKAKFAKLGEEHIRVLDKPIGSGNEGFDKYSITRDEAGNETETLVEKGEDQNITTEKTIVGKTVKTYKASGEVVQASEGASKSGTKVIGEKNVEVVSAVKAAAPAELEKEVKAPVVEKVLLSEAQTKEMIESLKSTSDKHDMMSDEILSDTVETNHFIFKGNAKSFLHDQIRKEPAIKDWINFVEIANKTIASGGDIDQSVFKEFGSVQKSMEAYVAYVGNPNDDTHNQWVKTFDSKELQLALDVNTDNLPMLANGSHIVRISDKAGAEFVLSDSKYTFSIKDGKLLKMDKSEVVQEYSYEEAVDLAKKTAGK